MAGEYGIVQWWLQRNSYSAVGFDIGNTFDETEVDSVRKLYDKIMDDAVSTTRTDASASSLRSLRNQNRFRDVSTSQVASGAVNQIQEAFKRQVRTSTDDALTNYDVTTTTKNNVRREIVSGFEDIKISNIPNEVEGRMFESIQSTIEDPLIQQASIDITGEDLTRQELFDLWHTDRSTWSRIIFRKRAILFEV